MKRTHLGRCTASGRMAWHAMFAPLLWVMTTVAEAAVIENIAFTSRPDARLEVQLTFDEPPSADLESYTIEEPARIVVDLPQTRSALAEKHFSLSQPNTTSCHGARVRRIVLG